MLKLHHKELAYECGHNWLAVWLDGWLVVVMADYYDNYDGL